MDYVNCSMICGDYHAIRCLSAVAIFFAVRIRWISPASYGSTGLYTFATQYAIFHTKFSPTQMYENDGNIGNTEVAYNGDQMLEYRNFK